MEVTGVKGITLFSFRYHPIVLANIIITAIPPQSSRYPAASLHAPPAGWVGLRLAESLSKKRPPERHAPASGADAALRSDALAVSLRGALDMMTLSLCRAACAFVANGGWAEFGYARLDDHSRERFHRSGRWVRDLAALGRMFSTLPGLEDAVSGSDGGRLLGRVSGLLVGRAASEESLHAWVSLARRVSVRELKDAVAAAREAGSLWPVDSELAPGAGNHPSGMRPPRDSDDPDDTVGATRGPTSWSRAHYAELGITGTRG